MENPQVSGVQLTNTVGDAIVHMINEDYSVIPVTDEHGVYIGKISRKLLARMFEEAQKISKLSIGQLIKKKGIENIKAVSINERLPELLEAIMEEELVLVKDGEKIIGIITWWDILYNLKNCFTRRNPAGEREI
jgi:predicted transcriptional regulator